MFFLFTKLFQVPSFDFFYLWDTLLLDYSFNTFYLILITSVFAIIFGVLPAWFVSNYDFKLRNFFDLVLYLPLAIPTYIMSFTYSDLLSYTGPLQFFLRKNLPDVAPYFNNDYLQTSPALAHLPVTHITGKSAGRGCCATAPTRACVCLRPE